MTTDRIDILINAQNRTGGAFNQVRQELSGLNNFASSLNQGLVGLGAAAGIGAVVAGLQQIGSAIDEVSRRGAIFEQLGSVLDDYAESVGQAGNAFVEAGRKASAGTIADYELILNANRAIQFEVAQTSDQYAKLIELATALGRAQGISDTQALEFLTTGIARESRLILDNLGLIVDLDKATQAYATSLGKKAGELTQAERKQAILNEAFRQGETAIKANRDAADSAATRFERLDAATQNLKTSIGELLALTLSDPVGRAANFVAAATERFITEQTTQTVQRQIEELKKQRDAFQNLGPAKTLLGEQGSDAFNAQIEQYNQLLGNLYAQLREVSVQNGIFVNSLAEVEDFGIGAGAGVDRTSTAARVAASEAERLKYAALDGAEGLSTLESFAWSTGAALDEVTQAMSRAQAVGSRLGSIRSAAINQAQSLALRAVQAGGDPAQISAMYGEIADELSNVSLNWDNTAEATFENKLALEEVGAEYSTVLEGIIEADRAAKQFAREGMAEAERAAKQAAAEAEAAFNSLKSKVSGVLSESLNVGVGVNPDEILGRPDAINENARRLADMAVKGFDSPWYDYFRNEFPALFQEFFSGAAGDDGVKKQAARLLKDFEDGLRPELLDKDKAKERVKRILLGEASLSELAQQIASELSAEFGGSISLGKIQATANAALGVDEGGTEKLAQSLTGAANEATGQLTGAGATFRSDIQAAVGEFRAAVTEADTQLGATLTGTTTNIATQLTTVGKTFRDGIVSALDGVGEVVAIALDKQFRAENNLKTVTDAGRANGEAWGIGFLATVRDNVPPALVEILASLVGTQLESIQARNATLNGAN